MYTILRKNKDIYKVITLKCYYYYTVHLYKNNRLYKRFNTDEDESIFHARVRKYNLSRGFIFIKGSRL